MIDENQRTTTGDLFRDLKKKYPKNWDKLVIWIQYDSYTAHPIFDGGYSFEKTSDDPPQPILVFQG